MYSGPGNNSDPAQQTCTRCGRVLPAVGGCPNCANAYLGTQGYSSTSGWGSVPSDSTMPRWLLLAGCILLLSGLVYVIVPRSGSESTAVPSAVTSAPSPIATPVDAPVTAESTPAPVQRESPVLAVTPVSKVPSPKALTAPTTALVTLSSPDKTNDAFWQAKAQRDLRDAGTYEPTQAEKDYWQALQWQDHVGLSDETRGSDFVMRRPEIFGNGRR